MKFFTAFLFSLVSLLSLSSVLCDIPGDLITSFPGYPGGKMKSPNYSGYIQVAPTRFLHYNLVLSELNPATDPLILWMNGGPGCSSLDGFFYEQGPVRFTGAVDSNGIPLLTDNPNRWNQFSSVVYLEAPAGVGYSYSTDSSWSPSDNTTADDNFSFLQGFFQGFTEFSNNDFYITGESYAGVYVPMLADLVRINNARGVSKINIKGFAVGNGCHGNAEGICGSDPQANEIEVGNYHDHMLFSPVLWDAIEGNCTNWNSPSLTCDALVTEAFSEAGTFNVYDIYNECSNGDATPNSTAPLAKRSSARYTNLRAPVRGHMGKHLRKVAMMPEADHPCDDVDAATYLNPQSTRTAFHVQPESVTGGFALCGNVNYQQNWPNLATGYPQLIASMKVLIFSGDSDACVPFRDSWAFSAGLGYPVATPWQSWSVDSQIGGYFVEYEAPNSQFTFLTIKASGHMVPQYRPVESFAFIRTFVTNGQFKKIETKNWKL